MSIADINDPTDVPRDPTQLNFPIARQLAIVEKLEELGTEDFTRTNIFEEIFEPCLEFSPGNIYSKPTIQSEAQKLADAIRNLSHIEFPFTEVDDVRVFIESYRNKLVVFRSGPGKNNSPTKYRDSGFMEDFCRKAESVLSALAIQANELEDESHFAYDLHKMGADKNLDDAMPKMKKKINADSGDLASHLRQLESLASADRKPPSPSVSNKPHSSKESFLGRFLGRVS